MKKGKNHDPTGTAMKQKQCLFEYGEGMENINNGIGAYKGPSHIQNIQKAYHVPASQSNEKEMSFPDSKRGIKPGEQIVRDRKSSKRGGKNFISPVPFNLEDNTISIMMDSN